MTTYALGSYQSGLACLAVEYDGLMSAIVARYFATSAANAQFQIELRIDNGLSIKMVWLHELWNLFANQLLQISYATLDHVSLKAKYEVVNDAIAILHDGGTYLYVAAAQLDELQGIAPRLDTADTAQLYFLGHL